MNGHFAAVGDAPTAQQYEHGIQVVDEDKQYKSVPSALARSPSSCSSAVQCSTCGGVYSAAQGQVYAALLEVSM